MRQSPEKLMYLIYIRIKSSQELPPKYTEQVADLALK